MKLKIIYYIIFLSFFNLVGCKKFLKQEPYNRISIDDIFKDFEGARTTAVGCYDNLIEFSMYGRDLMIYPDLAAGNIKYVRPTNQLFFNSYNYLNNTSTNNNDLKNFGDKAYNSIYRANSILENIDKIEDASQLQKNRFKADAFLIRALSHFSLVNVFAQMPNFTTDASHTGIVLRLKNTIGIVPLAPPSTVAQVYTEINNDIDSAKALYTNSVNIYSTGSAKTWLSLNAAKALQSRVKLYSEKNAEVVALTTDLINAASNFPLLTNAGYVNAWRGKNLLSESIFEINFGNRIAGSMGSYFNPVSNTINFAPSNDLLNLYAASDVRSNNNMYYNSTLSGLGSFPFTKKWSGYNDSANNIRLFRLSEIYLSRAEALAKIGDATSLLAACNDLNIIRKRGLTTAVNILPAIGQTALINEILLERRRELCFEGHLLYDLARNKKDIIKIDCSATSNCSVIYPSPRFIVPFPTN